jgi:hypothetical protein|tara:strand:- start:9965 stop:10468 length:504 start_codon:yes stop_codon:yes gene_type:complete
MFAFYKKHNDKLYNKLVELSRNKFFYRQLKLPDTFETRAVLIFFHLAIILKINKKKKGKETLQIIFDNIFKNIETNIRELSYGDTKVNKTMKSLSKIFYDILYNLDKKDFISFENNSYLINKYFYVKIENDRDKTTKLAKYLDEFQNFCFDLDINSVLNGSLNFKYR